MSQLLVKDFWQAGELRTGYFDHDDEELLEQYSWCMGNRGYIVRTYPTLQSFHREKMGLKPGDERQVDHINRVRSDNRRSNLRIVSALENKWNQGARPGAKHPEVGVFWNNRTQRWGASIKRIGQRKEKLCWTEQEAIDLARTWREQWRLTGRLD